MTDQDKTEKESTQDLESSVLSWNANIDKLLAKWCDQAKCFEWMHSESYDYTSKRARSFMISINLLTISLNEINSLKAYISVFRYRILKNLFCTLLKHLLKLI